MSTTEGFCKKKYAYPTVSPTPFSFSTRMSNDSSPVFFSHLMLHQFRLPMMNLPLEGVPSVSWIKTGSCIGRRLTILLPSRSCVTTYHFFVCKLVVHALVGFRREGVHHDQNAIRWTAKRKARINAVAFEYSRSIYNCAWWNVSLIGTRETEYGH